jgi:hypothetical protein
MMTSPECEWFIDAGAWEMYLLSIDKYLRPGCIDIHVEAAIALRERWRRRRYEMEYCQLYHVLQRGKAIRYHLEGKQHRACDNSQAQ